MTPEDRVVIVGDAALLEASADEFSAEFYATLFELDPSLRELFPAEMDAQRRKLFDELGVIVARATGVADGPSAHDFARRVGRLGERHDVYGVTVTMFDLVEVALLAAVRHVVPDFDDRHESAWTRLYRLVASGMQGR